MKTTSLWRPIVITLFLLFMIIPLVATFHVFHLHPLGSHPLARRFHPGLVGSGNLTPPLSIHTEEFLYYFHCHNALPVAARHPNGILDAIKSPQGKADRRIDHQFLFWCSGCHSSPLAHTVLCQNTLVTGHQPPRHPGGCLHGAISSIYVPPSH